MTEWEILAENGKHKKFKVYFKEKKGLFDKYFNH
jgi:hypothetical protein